MLSYFFASSVVLPAIVGFAAGVARFVGVVGVGSGGRLFQRRLGLWLFASSLYNISY